MLSHKACLRAATRRPANIDATAAQDPNGAYLFHRAGEPQPLENRLQSDLLAFLHRGKIPSGDEIRGVGGGRADIEVKIDRHRFILEVKRELVDGSFDSIMGSYGGQAKEDLASDEREARIPVRARPDEAGPVDTGHRDPKGSLV